MGDCVGLRTRIGLGVFSRDGGSIELPPGTGMEMCCPQCGTLAADRGQCSVHFREVFKENEEDSHLQPTSVIGLEVDCRSCGCYGKSPMLPATYKFMKERKEKKKP